MVVDQPSYFFLDMRTFLIMGAGFVFLTGVGIQVLMSQLIKIGLRGSAQYWVWATRTLALSWLLIAFGDLLPELATVTVANLGYLLSVCFIYQSVRCFDGLRPSRHLIAFVILVMSSVLACRYVVDSYDLRVGIQSIAVSLPLVLASRQLFRTRTGKSSHEFGRHQIAFWLALCASFFMARVIVTIVQGGAPPVLENSLIQTLFLGCGLISMVGLILTYFLLYSGRITAELAQQAHHDVLTGLLNRRAFEAQGERALSRARVRKIPLAVLLLDVDHFKAINDTHGHAAGDHALGTIADTLRLNIRPNDIIARLGGDEFAVIVIGQSDIHIVALARRLAEAVKTQSVDYPGKLEVSVGSAMFESSSDTLASLLDRADKALYERKRDRPTQSRRTLPLGVYANAPQ
jgi:diguanylate cyclase (GGDEF)-like protein